MRRLKPIITPAIVIAVGLSLLAGGPTATAQGVFNDITGCYDDPSGIAPPVCYNQPGNNRPPPAPEPDVWGALAVSPSTLTWGNSWNYSTQRQAQAAALRSCRTGAGHPADCRIAVTVPDVCVALATSAAQRVWTIAGPIGASNFAGDSAVMKCQRAGGRDCRVAVAFCADGQRHVLNGETRFYNGNPVFTPNGQQPFGRR